MSPGFQRQWSHCSLFPFINSKAPYVPRPPLQLQQLSAMQTTAHNTIYCIVIVWITKPTYPRLRICDIGTWRITNWIIIIIIIIICHYKLTNKPWKWIMISCRNLDRKSEPQPKSHPPIPLASGHQCMLGLFNISTEKSTATNNWVIIIQQTRIINIFNVSLWPLHLIIISNHGHIMLIMYIYCRLHW